MLTRETLGLNCVLMWCSRCEHLVLLRGKKQLKSEWWRLQPEQLKDLAEIKDVERFVELSTQKLKSNVID